MTAISMLGNVPDLRNEIGRIKSWHTIDLGNGTVTPGHADNVATLGRIGLPQRLDGKTVLDIGAGTGSTPSKRSDEGPPVCSRQTPSRGGAGDGGRRPASSSRGRRSARRSKISPSTCSISRRSGSANFDLVLILGVLYHMRHPLLALERVASVTKDQLVLETHVDLL